MIKNNNVAAVEPGEETARLVSERLKKRRHPYDKILPIQESIKQDARWKADRAFHALLLTIDALIGPGNEDARARARIPAGVRGLLKRGIRVFVVTTEHRKGLDGIRQIVIKRDYQAQHEQIVGEVLAEGIKFDNLLVAVDCRDAHVFNHVLLMYQLKDAAIPEAALRHRTLLHPYGTDGDLKHVLDDQVFLPVVGGGTILKHVDAVEWLIATHVFARPINITESSELVSKQTVLAELASVAKLAEANKARSLQLLRDSAKRLKRPSVEIFDDRSGAVFFRPDDWRSIEAHSAPLNQYFTQRLPGYWQDDRPCYRRVLFSPTKVLLRGEQYYANMRNESPFVRIERMTHEMGEIRKQLSGCGVQHGADLKLQEWKLVLALLDQVRSTALQFYSFIHAAIRLYGTRDEDGIVVEKMEALRGSQDSGINGLLYSSVSAYYAWIFGDYQRAQNACRDVNECWNSTSESFAEAAKLASDRSAARSLGDLVRRWREADHPGENLLTALLAEEALNSRGVTHAVGIGWGGIELPLVFQYLCSRNRPSGKWPVHVHIAQFSHYRGGTRNNSVKWTQFPDPAQPFDVKGKVVALFDDNTLTGYTLERVRDDLLLKGAKEVRLFVTRYSGERRYAHMKMTEHGVIDPEVLRNEVGGYIGETPFARSWSAKPKDYKSPIGVFSLARRRILECIHNNSTVQLYDREGF